MSAAEVSQRIRAWPVCPNAIVRDPEFAQRIAAEGLVPAGGSPEQMMTLVKTEIVNWARVVKHTGLKAE